MANILAKYGIKEVADVMLYDINDDGSLGAPVLYLDTLKVSTIEQTAEEVSARGGKGNPELISWNYNKEINITLEDALFSAKSMAIMFGNGTVTGESDTTVTQHFVWTATSSGSTKPSTMTKNGKTYTISNASIYSMDDMSVVSSVSSGTNYYVVAQGTTTAGKVQKIEISNDTFPGTYTLIGDTYARSYDTGKDEFYQFIIHKAKMQANQTITLQAEGDPSTFSFSMKVLKPSTGNMMELIKYDLSQAT